MTGFSAGVSVGGSAVGAVGGAVGAAAGAVGGAISASPVGTVAGAVAGAVGVGVGVASALGALIPATIFCTDPTAIGVVPFDFNPEKITITRTATVTSYPSTGPAQPTGSSGSATKKTDPPDISISDIVFEGLTTKWRCDQLLKWLSLSALNPVALAAQALGLPQTTNPPQVTFMWGPPMVGFFYDVRISSCTINYERFMPMGIPIRAKVTLKMRQVPSLLSDLPTNPTSGGVAGRRTHLVKEGESLASIAMQYYGRPGFWRRVAAVNQIDNPHRVRPGTTVYLPGMGELTEAAP